MVKDQAALAGPSRPTELLSNIAVQGGVHYVFDYTEDQLRVTNPRAKKVKKEKGGAGDGRRGKKCSLGDAGDAGDAGVKEKRRKN